MAPFSSTSVSFLPTAREMQQLDQLVMKEKGIPSLDLMEQVAREFSRVLLLYYRERALKNKRTVILVGPGNNGGDGLVVSRILHQSKQIPVTAVIAGSDKLSADCKENISRLLSVGGKIVRFGDGSAVSKEIPTISDSELTQLIRRAGILIDALLGTGQSGAPRGNIEALLEHANSINLPHKIALDTPTGISTDTGEAFQPGFKADLTLTVQLKKLGMTQGEARERCGEVRAIKAGLSSPNWSSEFSGTDSRALNSLPKRLSTSHKGSYGDVLIVAGSKKMPGAGALAALGALSTGVGKVTLTTFEELPTLPPEIMRVPITGDTFGLKDLKTLSPYLKPGVMDALVFGPGVGTDPDVSEFLKEIIDAVDALAIPTVIDADALNLLASYPKENFIGKLTNSIITPHPGEASRLLNISTGEILKNRPEAVKALTDRYGSVSLLKGAGTLIWDGKEGKVNETGTAYLATGGSGDVLSGVIGGLSAQGIEIFEAGALGSHLHGRAAELCGDSPLLPSSLTTHIRRLVGDGTP